MSQETIKTQSVQPTTVLNVGSGKAGVPLPKWYDGWDVVRLDIDPRVAPDILMDARELVKFERTFDACYSSHNLEHFSTHDGGIVIRGMRHVLKPGGFVDVSVPDVGGLLQQAGERGWDLDTFMYQSSGGPICVRDMLYGYERQSEFSDHPEYMVHKNAFSARTLHLLLSWCGFGAVFVAPSDFQLRAVAFDSDPGNDALKALGLVRE